MSWGRQWLQINTVYKKLKVSKYRLFEMMWIQCLITVLRQFFKSICTTNHSDGKKTKTFAVLWLQIIRNQWTNMCYVNIFDMSCFLMIVMLFEFHHIFFSMSKSHSPVSLSKQQLTDHPAGQTISTHHLGSTNPSFFFYLFWHHPPPTTCWTMKL